MLKLIIPDQFFAACTVRMSFPSFTLTYLPSPQLAVHRGGHQVPLSKMSADCLAHFYVRSDVYSMGLVLWEMCRRTVTGEGEKYGCVRCVGV